MLGTVCVGAYEITRRVTPACERAQPTEHEPAVNRSPEIVRLPPLSKRNVRDGEVFAHGSSVKDAHASIKSAGWPSGLPVTLSEGTNPPDALTPPPAASTPTYMFE